MEGKDTKNKFLLFLILLISFLGGFFTVSDSARSPALFIFGDSLIDNGNNNYIPAIARANYPPYGIDIGGPTGRFCNGLTVPDYAARYLGVKSPPPYLSLSSKSNLVLRGVNYASAAAGILDETGKHYGSRVTMNEQIALFVSTLRIQLPLLIKNQGALSKYIADSLFMINIGSNDYINNYLLPLLYNSRSIYSSDAFAKLLINNLSRQLESLYRLGARKFVVTGVGPLGCIPSQLAMNKTTTSQCIDSVNDLVVTFNCHLVQLVSQLNSTLSGSFFVYQDVYSPFTEMVNNPSKYGFTEVKQACCGNGRYGGGFTCLPLQTPCTARDKYVFWDAFHPTQAVNAIIAAGCFGENATDCHPISGSMLAQL
ncbi:GDSL-motif lipase 7 [Carex rostrata]